MHNKHTLNKNNQGSVTYRALKKPESDKKLPKEKKEETL
jgi:hypothetical protein